MSAGGSWPVIVPARVKSVLKGPSVQPGWVPSPISVTSSTPLPSPSEFSSSTQKKASAFVTVPSRFRSQSGSPSDTRTSQP